jgi:Polyketide cyclase / dehydrase and lipid transport
VSRQSFSVTRVADCPREEVWALISTATTWKDWAGIIRSSLEREGDPAPDGIGSIRRFGPPGVGSREEVVAWEAPSHLGYVILSGMPVRDYRADIRLEETSADSPDKISPDKSGKQTTIHWSATFDPLIPGTGPLMRMILGKMIGRFASRAARHAASMSR